MAVRTAIDIAAGLLAAVDRKARRLQISRSRLIPRALEREIADGTSWSPGFFEALRCRSPGDDRAFAESMSEIGKRRSIKRAPKL